MKQPFLNRHRDERGVALILTLAILVLVTLLVVGFAINMRVETAISKNYAEQVRARQFALAAVDEAVGLLRLATPSINILTNWASGPGMVFMRAGSGSYTNIPLCSLDDSGEEPFDINYRRLRRIMRTDNTNLFVGWKRWVLPNQPTSGRNNLIGRYCYWIDDEASKININTARRRYEPPAYTPEDIDLRAINSSMFTEDMANRSYQFGTNTGYASPNSWSVIDPNNATLALLSHSNHFRVTTFSQDTRLTPWGAPCMNLNTNILTTNPTDYLRAVTNMLGNAHLNGWFGKTYRDKYDNLMQIAANIKDYIDVDDVPTDSGGFPPSYLGLEKTPYLNEFVISNHFIITVNTNWLIIERRTTTMMELWHMYPPPAPNYDLGSHTITIANRPSITYSWDPAPQTFTPITMNLSGTMTPAPWSGAYQVFSYPEPSVVSSGVDANVRITFNDGTVTAQFEGPGGRIDYASIRLTNHANIFLTRGMAGRTTNMMWVSACRDPRVRPVNKYWNPVGGGGGQQTFGHNTLGRFNTGTVFYDVSTTNTVMGTPVWLRSDGGVIGRTPEYSCHTNISNTGTLGSVGELQFIHTGVPWRTLALRPQLTEEKTQNLIPDWAVLDLFTTSPRLMGRININSQVYTGQGVHVRATLQREHPIRALYYSPFQAARIPGGRTASNIQNRVWEPLHGYYPPVSWAPFNEHAYGLIGQVCEVEGMTSNNVAKVISERGIRYIANLITTRSNAFSIWAVGQTIADVNRDGRYNAAHGDEITSEILVHVVVERYENPAVTGPNRIRYRTRYFQYY